MMEKFTRKPSVKAKILPDGYVLLQLDGSDRVYTLTPLGGLVWEFCDGRSSFNDIIVRISNIDEIEPMQDLSLQVADLLQELNKCRLITSGSCSTVEAQKPGCATTV